MINPSRMSVSCVNIGCGQTPIPGWYNFDNSYSLRLAECPEVIIHLLGELRLIGKEQKDFILFAKQHNILWADAARHIPFPANSVAVLYASHLIEHLDREEANFFLKEAFRVLVPNGTIRLVAPDMKKLVEEYRGHGDADRLVERTFLGSHRPKTLRSIIKYFIVGPREHLWMYDGVSLSRLLSVMGFTEPRILEPGATTISDPGGLDLFERSSESVYVEARKPSGPETRVK